MPGIKEKEKKECCNLRVTVIIIFKKTSWKARLNKNEKKSYQSRYNKTQVSMLSFLNTKQCRSSKGINRTFKPGEELEKNVVPVQPNGKMLIKLSIRGPGRLFCEQALALCLSISLHVNPFQFFCPHHPFSLN